MRAWRGVVLLTSVIALTACSTFLAEVAADPIAEDLEEYVSLLDSIAERQEELSDAYNDRFLDEGTTDEEAYEILVDEIIPGYRDFVQDVEEYRPQTEAVRDLHEQFISALGSQYNAFTQMLAALEYFDVTLITDANERLDEARREFRGFERELESLMREHGVAWPEE
jgi:hypothetical protein